MKLASILDPNNIICGVPSGSRQEIYLYMLDAVSRHIGLDPTVLTDYVERMIAYEDMTNIPYEGVAIPHLRLTELDDLHIIVAILAEPVTLKTSDLQPVELVIMSLISGNTSDTYLKSLSAFMRYFNRPGNLQRAAAVTEAEQFIALLERDQVKLKKDITAEDVMYTTFVTLKPDDEVKVALNSFTGAALALPVLDDDGKLLGVLDALQLIKSCIPEYIMLMDNFRFLTSFEPFQKMINIGDNALVREHMVAPAQLISPDTPLIQLTISLVKREADTIFVVDDRQHLLGVITLENLLHKILRG